MIFLLLKGKDRRNINPIRTQLISLDTLFIWKIGKQIRFPCLYKDFPSVHGRNEYNIVISLSRIDRVFTALQYSNFVCLLNTLKQELIIRYTF